MGKGNSAPQAPDPVATAQAQTQSNQATAVTQAGLNMVNQVTPLGNLSYDQTGTWSDGTPRYTATTTYSPQQQEILDQSSAASKNLAQLANDQSAFLGNYLKDDVDLSWNNVSNFISGTYADPFNKQWGDNQSKLEANLVNRGIMPGSAQYTKALQDFNTSKSSAYDSLLNDSYSTGVNTLLAQRNQPINEITALLSGSQVSNPAFASTPQTGVAGTDVAGITQSGYQNAMNAYNSAQTSQNQMFGGLFSAGASLLPLFLA